MIPVSLALGLVTIAFLLYGYVTRTFHYWKSRTVPGPKPVPFFGNMKEFSQKTKHMGVILQDKQFPNEKLVGIYFMTSPRLLVRDLDVIKHIMIKDFDVFGDRGIEFGKDGLGANMFHADNDTWQALRNRFSPLFTSGKLKNMFYLMTERADKLKDYVDSISDTHPEQDVHNLMQKYTMSTIAACAFGMDIDLLHEKHEVFDDVDKFSLSLNKYAFEFDMLFPGVLKKLNLRLFPRELTHFFYQLVRNIVSQRGGVPIGRKDFMDLILELKQQGQITTTKRYDNNQTLTLNLTEDVMAAQAFIFYIAGFETTAATVSYLLYQLALNPDIQDKLLAEIDQTLAESNSVVEYDTIQSMPYLEKVFNETLRMYPVGDPIQRIAKTDYHIPGTNLTINKGICVLMSPMGIHHDERYYPKPHIFDPERFSPEQTGKRHPCAYMPFGTGPRNCIGMRFAKLQGSVGLVKLLSKFRVEPSKNTPREMDFEPGKIIVGPKGGKLYLEFVRRKPMTI